MLAEGLVEGARIAFQLNWNLEVAIEGCMEARYIGKPEMRFFFANRIKYGSHFLSHEYYEPVPFVYGLTIHSMSICSSK